MSGFAEVNYSIQVSIYAHRKFGPMANMSSGSANRLREEYEESLKASPQKRMRMLRNRHGHTFHNKSGSNPSANKARSARIGKV